MSFTSVGARVCGVALLEEAIAFERRNRLVVGGEVFGSGAVGAGAVELEGFLSRWRGGGLEWDE